ncbi:efflux RND transporter periplasmic adaptor subunit [Pseudomonas sp. PI1]|uniref:efflux RND transporter periplasmic adaptor subunit n=1 Tax=Pseudomonas sp. PI1 TaxID=1582493 RepID=UPI000A89FB64|nr:efflux RND transporter periplasmic adaptor subunit [Pseudomonas sp. PI1]
MNETEHDAVRRRRAIFLISASVALIVVGIATHWLLSPRTKIQPTTRPSVPVSVSVATRQNVPVELTGLGAVQASLTVGIRPQVDGTLQDVLFTEGQDVKKGDVLAKIDPRLFKAALDQARGKKAQDAALLVSAEKDLTRYKTLALSDSIARQTVDHQQATVDQLKASIAADEAAIDTAQTQLDYTSIRAPSDGRIGIRSIDPGNVVHVSDAQPIVILMRIRPSAVLFTLPARFLDDVRSALAHGPVVVTAFDQNNRRALSAGKLLLVDNAVDQATDTMRLKAIFPNDDERLWPGEFVNARLSLKTLSDALVIPSSAVQRGPQGLFVWIVTSKDTAEPRSIEVGPTTGDLTVITSGLSDGERVVTDGQFKLKRDARVQVRRTSPRSPTSEGAR